MITLPGRAIRIFVLALAALTGLAAGPALAASASRSSSFTYHATTGILLTETVQPGGGAGIELTTTYVHDAFGNRTQVQVGSNLGTNSVRTSTAAYDASGRFATIATNPLSHSESRNWDPRFGVVVSVTDPNNLTTSYTYDNFGRRTLETRPDGNKTKAEYLYCNGVAGGTAACPAGAVYLIQVTPLNSTDVQNAPWVKTYFDMLEREIQQETQGFNGTTVLVQTEYDSMGRVMRKRLPRFAGDTSERWVSFTYDTLGRVIEETRPDLTKAQVTYNGLVKVETAYVAAGNTRTRTTTRNGAGQVIQAKDHQNQVTTFAYDPFGNLLTTTDPVGNQTTATYDVRGRRLTLTDPDLGARSFSYNAFGEVLTETNARGLVTTATYDKLGRMLTRSAPDAANIRGENATWTFNPTTGRLTTATAVNGTANYTRTHTYDTLGRPVGVSTTIGTHTANFTATYDTNSRLDTVTYPGLNSGAAGLMVRYRYTSLGFEQQLERASDNAVYAKTISRDAAGRALQTDMVWAPNAVRTYRTWDENTGRLTQMETVGPGASEALVERHAYAWDGFGNLSSRATTYPLTATTTTTMAETFGYDTLNRLISVQTTRADNGAVLNRAFTYDGIGNLTSRSDVGTYAYPLSGQNVQRPHTPTQIAHVAGSVFGPLADQPWNFTYDADGNMLTGAGRTATWTSFNMPATVALGGAELRWLYGPERQRMRETLTGTAHTLQVDGFAGARFERRLRVSNNQVTATSFLVFGGEMVALATEASTAPGTITTVWQLKDHLGSTTTLLNSSGQLSGARKGYDVWGKRRHVTGADDASNSITSGSNRDYTGHEYLEEIRLVHMNGRIYDPVVARFLSPDPFIDNPLDLQSLNRYTYVNNNPLAYTDPSGYFKIGKFFSRAFGGVQKFLQRNPIAALAVGIAIGALTGIYFDVGIFSWQAAVVAGTVSGGLTGGLKGAIFGAASGLLTAGIGELGLTALGGAEFLAKAALHGAAHGALAEAQGGEFGPAFLAASFSHTAGSFVGQLNLGGDAHVKFAAKIATNTIIGGTASVIGGGKFQNGAATGAFVGAYNGLREMLIGRLAHAAIEQDIISRNGGYPAGWQDEYSVPGASRRADLAHLGAGMAFEIKPDTANMNAAATQLRETAAANGLAVGNSRIFTMTGQVSVLGHTVPYAPAIGAGLDGIIVYNVPGSLAQAVGQALTQAWRPRSVSNPMPLPSPVGPRGIPIPVR